jgi:hypothetical protein
MPQNLAKQGLVAFFSGEGGIDRTLAASTPQAIILQPFTARWQAAPLSEKAPKSDK